MKDIAIVAINESILSSVTIKPFSRPHSSPTSSATGRTKLPLIDDACAASAAASATTPPRDISFLPCAITKINAYVTIRRLKASLNSVLKLVFVNTFPPLTALKNTNTNMRPNTGIMSDRCVLIQLFAPPFSCFFISVFIRKHLSPISCN